jgi:transposase
MRFIGLDVHRDFCEVAIAEAGAVRSAGRVETEPDQVHATLVRNLKGKPPVSDLFGARSRRWLADQELPADEQETVAACLRQISFLDDEIGRVERALAEQVLASSEMRRLLTLPGVNFVTAAALLAAIGEIGRFPTARQLVSYLGLDPRVNQSGSEPARHGRISKQGPGETRHVLVEAAWHAARTSGPLRAFHQRVATRRGRNIATVAVARKLAVICWHMLSRGEDYAFARPSLTREKLRRLELMTGAERQKGKRISVWVSREQHRLDKELAAQAELAYRRLVQDWQPAIRGAGAAPGRATCGPSSGQAARQDTAPRPAL